MSRAVAVLVAALAVLAPCASAVNPALGVAVTSPGLQTLGNFLVDILNTALSQPIDIPPIHIDTHVAEPIGHITLDLTNIVVSGFKLGAPTAATAAPADVHLDVVLDSLNFQADYKWRKVNWPHASDHGSFTADITSGSVATTLDLGVTPNGTVTLAAADTTCSSSFTLHFDGKVAWLYNLLIDLLKGTIGKAVNKAVVDGLDKALTDLAAKLADIPLSSHLGGGKSEVDVSLAFTRIVTQGALLSLDNAFAMSDHATGAACPHTAVALPPSTPDAASAEFQLLFGDTALSCPLWVASTNGAISVNVSAATTPALGPFLNSKTLGTFIPALSAKFGDKPMAVAVTGTGVPALSSSATAGVVASVPLNLDFFVMVTNSSLAQAFTLRLDDGLGLDVFVNASAGTPPVPTLELRLSTLNASLSVVNSAIGSISVGGLDALLKFILPAVKNGIDGALAGFGIPLAPIAGIGLASPQVTYDDGFFAITTNLTVPEASLRRPAHPSMVVAQE